jgi:hypothetical protein
MNTEKPPSQEKKDRKNRFARIISLGGFCALILILMTVFFWPSVPDDDINSMGKIYPPRINKPTGKTFIVTPIEETKQKRQTEIVTVIDSSKSSKGKKYTIQIMAYPETGKNAAMEFVTELRKIQPDVHMERVYIPERGVWYRIFLGHFANHDEASTYMKEKDVLKAYPGSFVQTTRDRND